MEGYYEDLVRIGVDNYFLEIRGSVFVVILFFLV